MYIASTNGVGIWITKYHLIKYEYHLLAERMKAVPKDHTFSWLYISITNKTVKFICVWYQIPPLCG